MSKEVNVLFLDDEARIVHSLKSLFRRIYTVHTAIDGNTALKILQNNTIHVVVSDQRMPNMTGVEFLKQVNEVSPNSMRLLLTGYADLDAIVDSINEGEVFRFISKPWDNDKIKETVALAASAALETQRLATGQIEKTPKNEQAVLVINKNNDLAFMVDELTQEGYTMHYSPTIEQAMDVLEVEEIASIIAGVSVADKEAITSFLKLLKQQYPLIMTIVASDIADADMAIDLINQGQIFRYINKPIRPGILKVYLKSALRFYQQHKHQQGLLTRHQVEKPAETNHSISSRLFSRIKSLRNRLTR